MIRNAVLIASVAMSMIVAQRGVLMVHKNGMTADMTVDPSVARTGATVVRAAAVVKVVLEAREDSAENTATQRGDARAITAEPTAARQAMAVKEAGAAAKGMETRVTGAVVKVMAAKVD